MGDAKISDDGLFVAYQTGTEAANVLVLAATDKSWKREIPEARGAEFYAGGRMVAVETASGTLRLLTLGTDEERDIPNVKSFKLACNGVRTWLAFQTRSPSGDLIVGDSSAEHPRRISGVTDFLFNGIGTILIYTEVQNTGTVQLHWLDLTTGQDSVVWQGSEVGQIVISSSGLRIAFTGKNEPPATGRPSDTLILCSENAKRARPLLTPHDLALDGSPDVTWSDLKFSADGTRVIVTAKIAGPSLPKPTGRMVNIWNYKEPLEQDRQPSATQAEQRGRCYKYAADFGAHHKIVQLTYEHESCDAIRGDFALIRKQVGDLNESFWNPTGSTYLVSLVNGSRILLKKDALGYLPGYSSLSPTGKYVLYGDPQRKAYIVYDTNAKTWRDIPGQEGKDWSVGHNCLAQENQLRPPAVWLERDDAVLVYDQHDIWKLDLTGQKPILNLTLGFGLRHSLVLRLQSLIDPSSSDYQATDLEPRPEGGYILNAYDERSLNRGFYRLTSLSGAEPELLSLGAFGFKLDLSYRPLRAKNVPIYLVTRESTEEAPNVFWTSDFRAFNRISEVAPQKAFNWMTSEIVNWTTFDGLPCAGILYKPENFDAQKKYPVVIYFYNWLSVDVNKFEAKKGQGEYEPLSWLVSNGYIVFYPDIKYRTGTPYSRSLYDSVVSGAKTIAGFPYVDPKRMAIMGHSWGGEEVDFLVTHTDMFAAAYSGAGICDLVSNYGYGGGDGVTDCMYSMEVGLDGMEATPWQAPEKYIGGSALFSVNKVVTPILLMETKDDGAVASYQGREFFRALRRAGKRVWMLQYDHGDHVLYDPEDVFDLSTRISQFFDHYLKGKSPPRWMTEGVPAILKGVESGLEVDTSGRDP